MLKLSLFEGQKIVSFCLFVCVLLKSNELLILNSSCVCVLAAITSHRQALKCQTLFCLKLESDNVGETQEEVTTCRMQQDISEWLVDEFMLLMWR